MKYKQIQTKENYDKLLSSGMFWEFHPELSGDWEHDKVTFQIYDTSKNKHLIRIYDKFKTFSSFQQKMLEHGIVCEIIFDGDENLHGWRGFVYTVFERKDKIYFDVGCLENIIDVEQIVKDAAIKYCINNEINFLD